ncbi:MAG: hypothetical protein KGQ38_02065 [Actinomycetales bacterium]|nr:hypothetical protein [Actinomycetales bacterium]
MQADRLLRLGSIVLGLGIICTLIAILPLFLPNLELPSYWWGLSMLTAVGLILILLGLRKSAKVRSKS